MAFWENVIIFFFSLPIIVQSFVNHVERDKNNTSQWIFNLIGNRRNYQLPQ